jgi:hypothetical protein
MLYGDFLDGCIDGEMQIPDPGVVVFVDLAFPVVE